MQFYYTTISTYIILYQKLGENQQKKYRARDALLAFPKIPQIFPQDPVETNVLNTQNRSFLGKKENLGSIDPFPKLQQQNIKIVRFEANDQAKKILVRRYLISGGSRASRNFSLVLARTQARARARACVSNIRGSRGVPREPTERT